MNYKFYYENRIYKLENKVTESESILVWIALGIMIICGLVGALIFVFRKYKKVESQLNYEMTDVRNVARVTDNSKDSVSTSEKFARLEEENNI